MNLTRKTIAIGRIAGVQIGLSWSWLVIFALVVVYLAGVLFPSTNEGLASATYVAMGLTAAVLFFASLVLHELGHAIQARREGMEISGIDLWLLGGVARFTGMFPSAGAEFRIAIAGPLVTLVIGGTLVLAGTLITLPAAVDGVVVWLGLTNLFVLAFNLLPAFPLDGGRVLRSVLWKARDDVAWATRAAEAVGRALGAVMIAVGALTLFVSVGGLWLILIGWFVITTGTAEAHLVEAREAVAGLSAADAMTRDLATVDPGLTLQEFHSRILASQSHYEFPVTTAGVVVGLLVAADLNTVPRETWKTELVSELMRPIGQAVFVDETDSLAEVLTRLLQARRGCALVLGNSHLVGIITLSDIQHLIDLRRQRRPRMQRDRVEHPQPHHG